MKRTLLLVFLGLMMLLSLKNREVTAVAHKGQSTEPSAITAGGSITGTITDGIDSLANILVEASTLPDDKAISFL